MYNDYLKADKKQRKELDTKKAQSITTAFEKGKKFPMDVGKAKGIPYKVMEFIALDDQPSPLWGFEA